MPELNLTDLEEIAKDLTRCRAHRWGGGDVPGEMSYAAGLLDFITELRGRGHVEVVAEKRFEDGQRLTDLSHEIMPLQRLV